MLHHIRYLVLTGFFCLYGLIACAQHFAIANNKKRQSIHFKLVRSMVVIPLFINGHGPYNFILDTGVSLMLITDEKLTDSLGITNRRTIKIAGLGERQDYEAFVAPQVKIDITGLANSTISAAILKKDHFGLSAYAGIPIHGLLGYDFFNQLAVKISFTDSTLTVSKPGNMSIFRKATAIPISIEERKPYIRTNITLADGTNAIHKLLLDLGAGHALSLEKADSLPANSIKANLGIGLNGLIEGSINRVKEITLGNYKIPDVITSFPNISNIKKTTVPRDGSLGMGMLKRFNIIFDYANGVIYLKPNMAFKERFDHDMSGLGYYSAGPQLDHVFVETVDEGSPAEEAGIMTNDEIVAINFKPVNKMTIQQIDDLFRSRDGRGVLLEICRGKTYETVVIKLRRRI